MINEIKYSEELAAKLDDPLKDVQKEITKKLRKESERYINELIYKNLAQAFHWYDKSDIRAYEKRVRVYLFTYLGRLVDCMLPFLDDTIDDNYAYYHPDVVKNLAMAWVVAIEIWRLRPSHIKYEMDDLCIEIDVARADLFQLLRRIIQCDSNILDYMYLLNEYLGIYTAGIVSELENIAEKSKEASTCLKN